MHRSPPPTHCPHPVPRRVALAAALLLAMPAAQAQNWIGPASGGSWFTRANWSTGTLPGNTLSLTTISPASGTAVVNYDSNTQTVLNPGLLLSAGTANGLGQLDLLTGELRVAGVVLLGAAPAGTGGNGKLRVLGTGKLTVTSFGSNALDIGNLAGSSGVVELGDSTGADTPSITTGQTIVGNAGSGRFEQWAGTHTVTNLLTIGKANGGSGHYALHGGTLSTVRLDLQRGSFVQDGGTAALGPVVMGGTTASATMTLRGGSLNAQVFLESGGPGLDRGTLQLEGGTLTTTATTNTVGRLQVGATGSAAPAVAYSIAAGRSWNANTTTVGHNAGGTGLLDVAGRLAGTALVVGGAADATGTLDQSAGTVELTDLSLATAAGATGTYQLRGGSLRTVHITGRTAGATARLNVDGGSLDLVDANLQTLSFGSAAGLSGSFELLPNRSISTDRTLVGEGGSGRFTHTAGGHSAGQLTLAQAAGSDGTYLFNGGTVSATTLGSGAGLARWVQTGGSATATTVQLADATGGAAQWQLDAGSVAATTLGSGAGAASLVQNGGSVTASQLALGNLAGGNGEYTLNAGTLALGSVANGAGTSTLRWNGGTLAVTGAMQVGNFSIANGLSWSQAANVAGTLDSAGSITVAGSLTVGGQLLNSGELLLQGGQVGGGARIDNSGAIHGHGRIDPAAGLTNGVTGVVLQSGGNLVLGNGTVVNEGSWSLLAGHQLQNAASFTNSGVLSLRGGRVTGSGSLANAAGGVVEGPGVITTAFSNAGTLLVAGGQLSVGPAFTNAAGGQVQLGGGAAVLAGGAVANAGLLIGQGRVNSAVTNSGAVRASGSGVGTLTFTQALANNGTLVAEGGQTLVLAAGFANGRNNGTVQLAGGTLDTQGQLVTNAPNASVQGYGILRTGLLNQGRLQLSGGSSQVLGSFTAFNGSQTVVSGASNVSFFAGAEFQSGSELRVSDGASATFFAPVIQRSGALFTGTGNKYFESVLAIGASPGLSVDAGSVTLGQNALYIAELGGLLPGTGYDQYQVAGRLTFGGTLRITSWNGFTGQAGQTFDLFDWGSTSGQFASIDSSGLLVAPGVQLDTSRLYLDGTISLTAAVPEPGTWALWLAGLGALGLWAGRRARPFGRDTA